MAKRPHGSGRVFQRGQIWWYRYYYQGKPIDESSKSTRKSEAERLLKIRLGEKASGTAPTPGSVTIAEICALVINDYEITKKRSLKDVVYRVDKHLKPMIGSLRASTFGGSQIGRYVAERRTAGAEDSTINRELSIVRRGYTLALRERPPLLMVAPYIPKLEEDNTRQGFLEEADYERVLAAMPHQLKALFVCAYHEGMRLGELRRLEWDWVDMEAETIRIPRKAAKTKQPRTVPIYGDMKPYIEAQLKERNEKYPVAHMCFSTWASRSARRHAAGSKRLQGGAAKSTKARSEAIGNTKYGTRGFIAAIGDGD